LRKEDEELYTKVDKWISYVTVALGQALSFWTSDLQIQRLEGWLQSYLLAMLYSPRKTCTPALVRVLELKSKLFTKPGASFKSFANFGNEAQYAQDVSILSKMRKVGFEEKYRLEYQLDAMCCRTGTCWAWVYRKYRKYYLVLCTKMVI
jgi:hypothetical protein